MRGTTIGLIIFAVVAALASFLLWNSWDLSRTGTAGTQRSRTWVSVAFVAVPTAVIATLALLDLLL
jgi:hypothetical protein